jgi:hypothetical protein
MSYFTDTQARITALPPRPSLTQHASEGVPPPSAGRPADTLPYERNLDRSADLAARAWVEGLLDRLEPEPTIPACSGTACILLNQVGSHIPVFAFFAEPYGRLLRNSSLE